MKVDTMRKIDRWFGIPLIFFISTIMKLVNKITSKNNQLSVTNALFIELSEMGSAIIADPAMRKLQKEGAELFFVIFINNAKSLELTQTIKNDNIYTIRDTNIIYLGIDTLRFIYWCRKNKIDTSIDLELFSRFTAILTALSGAKNRIGFHTHFDEGCYRGKIFNYPVRYNPHSHMVVNFLSLVNTALGKNSTIYPTFKITKKDTQLKKINISNKKQNELAQKIKTIYSEFVLSKQRIFIINPNASDLLPQRKWLPERFAEVGKKLLTKHADAIIILTGSPSEWLDIEKISKKIDSDRCINSAGYFNFNELPILYSIAKFMLTNDSGPAHFAAITNLKTLVIMGPETPNLYLPIGGNAEAIYLGLPCSPCVSAFNHRKTNCVSRPCITNITSKMVFDKIEYFMNANKGN